MLFDREQFLMIQEVNVLREAAAKTGFTLSDIQALVECELDTSHVLDYITAVMAKRMN
jgi:DNA-binding transcriptional MerR regulator